MDSKPIGVEEFEERLQVMRVRGWRVLGWPGRPRDRLILLRNILMEFDPSRKYTEEEINRVLRGVSVAGAGYVVLRRAMVEERFLVRTPSGDSYEAAPSGDDRFGDSVDELDPWRCSPQGWITRAERRLGALPGASVVDRSSDAGRLVSRWLQDGTRPEADGGSLTRLGFALLLRSRIFWASEAFREAIRRDRTSVLAHYGLALAELESGVTESAVGQLASALEVYEHVAPLWTVMCDALVQLEDYDQAEAAAEYAQHLFPGSRPLSLQLSKIRTARKRAEADRIPDEMAGFFAVAFGVAGGIVGGWVVLNSVGYPGFSDFVAGFLFCGFFTAMAAGVGPGRTQRTFLGINYAPVKVVVALRALVGLLLSLCVAVRLFG